MSDSQIQVFHREFSFSIWRGTTKVMPYAHMHADIELNLLTGGTGRYFLSGRFQEVLPDRLAVFWAGMPHRLCEISPGAEVIPMHLPLGWFLSWNIDGPLRDRLLNGELIQSELPDREGVSDAALFRNWTKDLDSDDVEVRHIVLLEVEARLRRLAKEVATDSPSEPALPTGRREAKPDDGHCIEVMASFISRCYRDPITVADVAGAAGLNPNYATTVFKQKIGLNIWEYLIRLRVSHAQRLLLTTDWTVERIALDCGFGSASRFFAAFRRRSGCTPQVYRQQH
jgi:AraC-like DNA-binding protein